MSKHDKIPRPQIGAFHRHEPAVWGTPCSQIEKLVQALALPELKTVYADAEQVATLPQGYEGLPDTFLDLGLLSGILSAFRQHPDAAWLVPACDLPLMQPATLEQLVSGRNPQKVATTFRSPHDDFPEPLVTRREPQAYPILLQSLNIGSQCSRKALIDNGVNLLTSDFPQDLTNANTQEESTVVFTVTPRTNQTNYLTCLFVTFKEI